MKNKQTLSLVALLAMPMALSAQETGIAPPADLDTSKPAVELKYDMQIGKTFDMDMNVDQTVPMMGQEINTTIMMGMKMEVAEGGDVAAKKVTTSYTRTGIDMNMMGQSMKYDSADGEAAANNPLSPMGMIVGQEFVMFMDENNEVTKIEGLDEIRAGLGGNPALAGQMDAFFDENQIKQMSNAWISEVFPDKAVKPGDSWPFSYSVVAPGAGEISYKGEAKLLGYTKVDGADVGVIDLNGNIDMEVSDGAVEGPMAAMGMKLSGGTNRSILYWDNELGYLRKMDTAQQMNMSLNNPQTGEAMSIPIKQTVTMDVDVQ